MSDATPIRDPESDPLLNPQNSVLALIDYQPEQYAGVRSVGHDALLAHVVVLGRVAATFDLPVVLSTVYVKH
ncbi:MAG: hydrolase, partial [Betaproteobacteria bacterium]